MKNVSRKLKKSEKFIILLKTGNIRENKNKYYLSFYSYFIAIINLFFRLFFCVRSLKYKNLTPTLSEGEEIVCIYISLDECSNSI